MQHLEMGEGLQLKKAGKHVGKLVFLYHICVSGALAKECHVPAASLVPHRLRSFCMLGPLWLRKRSFNWHSLWALSVIGTTVNLAYEGNPTKFQGKTIYYHDWHK